MLAEIATGLPGDWEPYYIEIFDGTGKNVAKLGVMQILTMLTAHLEEHLQTVRTIRAQSGLA